MAKKIPVTLTAQPEAFAFSSAAQPEGVAAIAADAFVKPESAEAVQGASTSQDAELLALIGEFNSIEGRIEAICGAQAVEAAREDYEFGSPEEVEGEAKLDALSAEQRPLFMQIMSTRALTVEGVRARALMFQAWDTDLADEGTPGGFYRTQMTSSLLRDLVALQS